MANRMTLPAGYPLRAGERVYQIEHTISAGSNAVVYQASYRDTLMPEHTHTVLIKELYPLDPSGGIARDDSMRLTVSIESEAFFQYHKQSFVLGNQAHLTLSEDGGGRVAENLDSFEANGTLYTVLSSRKGQVLSELLAGKPAFSNLTDTALCLHNLLSALQPFHVHHLLHLDVSPDNIFVLAPDASGDVSTDVILLDFNSVYSLDRRDQPEGDYYLGKPGYLSPEVALHKENALGPWTDLYSVAAVFYEMLTGEALPPDRELLDTAHLISPYQGLLLHEKECSAALVNAILRKGLEILPENRYRDVSEMQKDVKQLLDVLNGAITDYTPLLPPPAKKKMSTGKKLAVSAAIVAVLAVGGTVYLNSPLSPLNQPVENPTLDLTQIPLERDDSIALTRINERAPLPDSIMNLDIGTSAYVRATLKDFTHLRDVSRAFQSYEIWTFYNGAGDKRGWQTGGQTYDPFYSGDNSVRMELPFVDENDFDMDYVGLTLSDWNYDDAKVLFDITQFTLTDGGGNRYELTDLVGSHILYFPDGVDTWYLMTTQNAEFVKTFQDAYGGKLEVHAELNELDPLLEVTWESDDPEIATVDQAGNITGVSMGQAKISVTITDKNTSESRHTQMLVNVTKPY